MTQTFSPGDLVRARGREWITVPTPNVDWLALRPLSGSESDIQLIDPDLEPDPVTLASFGLPDVGDVSTQAGAQLLSESLRISQRRGAGPFRSAARLGFEPRAYQLVPLLMALRQEVVRLLIADDVGIGKTIEAGLVLREMIDRGEVDQFSVLCPPHLVDQWTTELKEKFDLDVKAVTASSARKLERGLPMSQTLFDAYPFTIVSLDYIKADKRRESFARACPSFVIVDEAHSCVGTHKGRQQRFDLLQRLSQSSERHMVFLTATPHSGDETAFARLLSLLNAEFGALTFEDEKYRERLARHFVQRRRIDITSKDWGEERVFPKHETAEAPYKLDSAHLAFHEAVIDYCFGAVQKAGESKQERRLAFWGTLALMRCVGSSPAAALSALRNRLQGQESQLEEHIFDEDGEDEDAVDLEPSTITGSDSELNALLQQAADLCDTADPKVDAIISLLKSIIKAGGQPVVFCRYIATAKYLGAALIKAFPKLAVEVVTGALPPDERKARVQEMGEHDGRLLVATDCLSEGINLQNLFNAVLHYDLSWNPTRHQQREGRVNRFGQAADTVKSILLFSPDSAIDGAVLDVILRKAEAIRKATGVTVPLPEERGALTDALMNAIVLRQGKSRNFELDLRFEDGTRAMETRWRDAEENERRSRARFAQNAIKPEEVAPEWQKLRALLGNPDELQRYLERALSRLKAPLQQKGAVSIAHLERVPTALSERLAARGLEGATRITFEEPAPPNTAVVTRNHPIPSTISDMLLESALETTDAPLESLGRTGAWPTKAVKEVTLVALLRLRFKLTVHARKQRTLLAEEAALIAFSSDNRIIMKDDDAQTLVSQEAVSDLPAHRREQIVAQALSRISSVLRDGPIADYARERAKVLERDHGRLRAAGASVPRVSVEAVTPVDIIGAYVLLPGEI